MCNRLFLTRQQRFYWIWTGYWLMWTANLKVSFCVCVCVCTGRTGKKNTANWTQRILHSGNQTLFLKSLTFRIKWRLQGNFMPVLLHGTLSLSHPMTENPHTRLLQVYPSWLRALQRWEKNLSLPPHCNWLACRKCHSVWSHWRDYWGIESKELLVAHFSTVCRNHRSLLHYISWHIDKA